MYKNMPCLGLLVIFACASFTSGDAAGQCESGFCRDKPPITRMRIAISELLTAQANGDAKTWVAKLSPKLETFFNGVKEELPWNSEEFVKTRFAALSHSQVKFIQPITRVDDNTVITTFQWTSRVKSTFEDINYGAWNQKIRFDKQGLIDRIETIADSMPLKYLTAAMQPYKHDKKAIVMGYLETFGKKDIAGTQNFLHSQLIVKRNGQPDVVQWQDPSFLQILHKHASAVKAESTLFVDAGNRACQVHVTWTFNLPNEPEPVVIRDAWYVTFHVDEPRMTVINSIVDMPALMTVYTPMQKDIQALQQQFQDRMAQQQQPQR